MCARHPAVMFVFEFANVDKAYTKRVILVSIHHICVSLSKFKLLLSKSNIIVKLKVVTRVTL